MAELLHWIALHHTGVPNEVASECMFNIQRSVCIKTKITSIKVDIQCVI